MAKRTKAQDGDRVVNKTTGETGTIMASYSEKGGTKYGVLPDDGPRRNTLWVKGDCEWSPYTMSKCPRCGDEGHHVIYCPYGDCGATLTLAAREALTKAGLDPRRTPGLADAEDAYDGPRLWTDRSRRRDMYRKMRRRVCALGDVVVDGHEGTDGTCTHCGEAA